MSWMFCVLTQDQIDKNGSALASPHTQWLPLVFSEVLTLWENSNYILELTALFIIVYYTMCIIIDISYFY